MRYSTFSAIAGFLAQATGLALPAEQLNTPQLAQRQTTTTSSVTTNCKNTPTARGCWSNGFNIDTDYSTKWPTTGKTRTYYLEVRNTTFTAATAPDGVPRQGLTFNGTVPGPLISADWGDDIVINVKNTLTNNGTAIHWHGIRQLNSSESDGVPGVTQCPIPPGGTMTYKFKATQYGSSWYHSHFTLQYGDGMVGPINIRGPATANYDEDLGSLMLQDWGHTSAFDLWYNVARHGAPPTLENGLINGTNTYTNTTTGQVLSGKRFVTKPWVKGRKYLIRLVNSGLDGYIKFAIDGHKFQVISNDFVPIKPYTTSNVILGNGQRYDIVVTADQEPKNYWLRAVWMTACSANDAGAADEIKGIVRYSGGPTTGNPTTTKDASITNVCGDEAQSNLVPHIAQNVGTFAAHNELDVGFELPVSPIDGSTLFRWTINSSSLILDWEKPSELLILNGSSPFPTPYNTVPVTPVNKWVYYVIENSAIALNHPIHLHGHDFSVVGQSSTPFDPATAKFNLTNPVRRDVATLPAGGYLAIAFFTDNPGAWLMHCHIAWHASQGLSMQFIERQPEIAKTIKNPTAFKNQCAKWSVFENSEIWPQDDSGI